MRRPRPALVRPVALALLAGGVHALAVAALVARLDYPVNALAVAPGGVPGAAVGLVALLAVPALLALRYRLVGPLSAVVVVGSRAVHLTVTTPPPEFSTLGGFTVVSGARYVDAYVDAWYVWLFAALLVGLAEYAVRVDRDWLPAPVRAAPLDALLRRDARDVRGALRTALLVAAGHAAVFLLLAADWGYFEPGAYLPSPWYLGLAVLAWTVLGLAVTGGVAAVLLARFRLVAPTAGLAVLVTRIGWAQNMPLPDDPLPVYFLGWFFFAGVLVALGGVEYALRVAGRWTRGRPAAD